MASTWEFNHLAHVPPISPLTKHHSKTKIVKRHNGVPPEGAKVPRPTIKYKSPHFLGIPKELRKILIEHISKLAENEAHTLSTKRPTPYMNILLTCRQLYHELEAFTRRAFVPWNAVDKLLAKVPNNKTIRQIRSLTLEIPQNASTTTIHNLTNFLCIVGSNLKELRLYFHGKDKYGTEIYTHGCGNLEDQPNEKKLPIDGQRFDRFNRVWQLMLLLKGLEVLVISNANLQVYEYMFLAGKPGLKYLKVASDPRSVLHQQHSQRLLGLLLTTPNKDSYPPVEVLNISANAALLSSRIASKLLPSLVHLTWSVPDSCFMGGMATPWYSQTANLFNALRLRAPKLEVLRVCIGGTGIYETEGGYDELIGAIRVNFPHVRTLKHFELHCKSKSWWFGKELVRATPGSVRHLYLSDRVIHPYDLYCAIRDYVLRAELPPIPRVREGKSNSAVARKQVANSKIESISNQLPNNSSPWMIDLRSKLYKVDPVITDEILEKRTHDPYHVTRQASTDRDNSFIEYDGNDLVGENLNRRDYIPFHTRDLLFLHYEYAHSEAPIQARCSLTALQTMLFLNGRLIDRLRNRHLAPYDRYQSNYSAQGLNEEQDSDGETALKSKNAYYNIMLFKHVYNGIENKWEREVLFKPVLSDLGDSIIDQPHDYFGNETQAETIFNNEPVARVEDLPKLTSLREEEVLVDGKCHWSCPDAPIEKSIQ